MVAVLAEPLAAPVWSGSPRHRRRFMTRFPYILVYEVRAESIEFVAVAHTRRDPGYWLDRILAGP